MEQQPEVNEAPDIDAAIAAAMEPEPSGDPPPEGEPAPEPELAAEGEAPPAEGEPEPEPEPEEPKISKAEYYAKLAEGQRANRLLREQLKEAKAAPKPKDLSELSGNALITELQKLGVNPDGYLNAMAGEDFVSPTAADPQNISPELKKKLAEVEEVKKQLAEMQQAQQQTQQTRIVYQEKRRIGGILEGAAAAAPGKYEYLMKTKDQGAVDMVFDRARGMYEETEVAPEYPDIMDEMETSCRDNAISFYEELEGMDFFKAYLTKRGKPSQTVTKGNGAQPTAQPKAITPKEDTATRRHLTEDEHLTYALQGLIPD